MIKECTLYETRMRRTNIKTLQTVLSNGSRSSSTALLLSGRSGRRQLDVRGLLVVIVSRWLWIVSNINGIEVIFGRTVQTSARSDVPASMQHDGKMKVRGSRTL